MVPARDIAELYQRDEAFKIQRYALHPRFRGDAAFDPVDPRRTRAERDDAGVGHGQKLYVALAQAIQRLRT